MVFRLSLPEACSGRLDIFDVTGRRVCTVSDGALPRGESLAQWSGDDARGSRAERGMYFARLLTPAGRASVKVVVTD